MKKVDDQIAQKFAIAAGMLMARVFSTPIKTNQRSCMFASGSAAAGALPTLPGPDSKFDVIGLGFVPGREWKGPAEVFVEEFRDGESKRWTNCRFWADTKDTPFYLLTDDPELCFSFDGYALVPLFAQPGGDNQEAGIKLARARLKEAALRLPLDEIRRHRMM